MDRRKEHYIISTKLVLTFIFKYMTYVTHFKLCTVNGREDN